MSLWSDKLSEAILTGALKVRIETQTDPRYGSIVHQTVSFELDSKFDPYHVESFSGPPERLCKCDHLIGAHGICRAHRMGVHGPERLCDCPEVRVG